MKVEVQESDQNGIIISTSKLKMYCYLRGTLAPEMDVMRSCFRTEGKSFMQAESFTNQTVLICLSNPKCP